MENSADQTETFNWLYPELLSKKELVDTLKRRYIKVADLELQDKEDLVELYNKYVLPLPQRKHRLNRRGREMTKKQIIGAKKRKNTDVSTTDLSNSDGQPPEKRCSTGLLNNHLSSPSAGDRLKPPPSCINFEKKKIKLNSGTKSQTDSPISSNLGKLKINQTGDGGDSGKTETDVTERKKIKLKEIEKTTEHFEESEGDKDTKKGTLDKSSPEPMDTSENANEGTKPKKIKLKKIAWP